MIIAKNAELLDVPKTVAKCPECGRTLIVDIYEYESDSKQVTEGGFHLFCKWEYNECFINNNWKNEHRGDQSGWMSAQTKVYEWLKEHVIVE